KIKNATQQISEYKQALVHLSDQDIKQVIRNSMKENKKIIEQLSEEGIVEQYDKSGRLSAAILNSDIWDNILIVLSLVPLMLKEKDKEKYNTYLLRQCLSTYLKPRYKHTFAARHYHHSAKVSLASVARTDMKQHIDKHYFLASVKVAQVFAEVFASETVVIFQDDKAKISLGIPAIGLLLVDERRPNENPKHLKNIIEYSNLFRTLDLDYLTICIHALYQSAYNPIKHSMASFSEKLTEITLPVDEYAPDAALLLNQNNGFLLSVTKGKNGHFVNLIHAFQYFDKLNIPSYNRSCLSISKEMHQHSYCSEFNKSLLAANLVNFKVAKDANKYNHVLLEEKVSDLHKIQSDIELELIEV
ncbi:13644_t:CDS:2, partial [Cetraspora pellucida]